MMMFCCFDVLTYVPGYVVVVSIVGIKSTSMEQKQHSLPEAQKDDGTVPTRETRFSLNDLDELANSQSKPL